MVGSLSFGKGRIKSYFQRSVVSQPRAFLYKSGRPLKEGLFQFLPGFEIQVGERLAGTVDISMVLFDYEVDRDHRLSEIALVRRGNPTLPIFILCDKAYAHVLVWAIFNRIDDCICFPEEGYRLRDKARMTARACKRDEPIDLLSDRVFGDATIDHAASYRTAKAMFMLKTRVGNAGLTVKQLAGVCNMSVSTFYRVFLREWGESVGDCLRRLRIERAVQLVETQPCSAAAIAARLGYQSVRRFLKDFKRYTSVDFEDYPVRTGRSDGFR